MTVRTCIHIHSSHYIACNELPPIGLDIYIEEDHYTVYEGQTQNPTIQLRFGRTQSNFTITLFPVSIREAINTTGFNLSAFITSDRDIEAIPGK